LGPAAGRGFPAAHFYKEKSLEKKARNGLGFDGALHRVGRVDDRGVDRFVKSRLGYLPFVQFLWKLNKESLPSSPEKPRATHAWLIFLHAKSALRMRPYECDLKKNLR